MSSCEMCWDNPCTCGHEAKRIERLRQDFDAFFPRPYVPPGEEWDFPSVKEFNDHPEFFERKEWRRRQKEKAK